MKTPKTREETDALLKRLGEIEIQRNKNQGSMNTHIQNLLKVEAFKDLPLQAEKAEITDALHKFLLAERPKMGKARSIKLNFGSLGFRARNAVEYVRGWKVAGIIEALRSYGLKHFIREKPSINRQAIKDEKDGEMKELLLKCGVKVEPGETFYADPDLKALADYQEKSQAKSA